MNPVKLHNVVHIFACPKCSGDLSISCDYMVCVKCSTKHPILRGMPRFVDEPSYTKSFSLEWLRHRYTQLSRRIGDKLNALDFEARTGLKIANPPAGLVLDAGCGSGRHAELLSRHGWKVIAVDMSLAVESAYENTKMYPNTLVVQADLNSLPFKERVIDACFSLGVLHHTPNPKATFNNIVRHLKKGGIMAVSVYSNEGILTKIHGATGDLYGSFFKRLRPETLIAITDSMVTLVRFPANLYVDPFEQYKRWLERKRRRASPVYVVYMVMPFLSVVQDLEWRKLNTFDYLSPKFASRHTYQEVIRWFMEAGFTNITKLPVPVSVKGTAT